MACDVARHEPNDHVTSQINHGDDVMSTVAVLWVAALAFPDDGGVSDYSACANVASKR
jgi:hypothetical protein